MYKGYWDLELVKDYIERNKGAEWMQIQLWNVYGLDSGLMRQNLVI